MATILGSLLLKITGDTADAHQAIDKVEKKAKGFSTFIKGAMGLGGAVIAFRALKNISKELIATYSVQETAEAKLQSAITATGKEGSISAEKLFDYASQLQEVTTYGDEATISAMALLQQLGDLSEEGIKQLTPLIQDFASTGLVNLETAASLVGKTLDSTTNALTRYGIVIDMSGTKEEKLAEITEGLQKKFGGLSKDLGTTATAAIEQYNNAVGDLKEAQGEAIAKGIEPFVRGLTKVITQMATAKREAIATKEAYEDLKNLGEEQVLTEDQLLLILKDQVAQSEKLVVSYQGMSQEANAAHKAAVKRLEDYQAAMAAVELAESHRAEAADEAARKKAEKELAEAKAAKELLAWQTMVNDKYSETEEANKAILAAEIEKWEHELTKADVYKPKIEAILEMLYAQRDAEEEVTQEITDRTRAYEILGKAGTDWIEAQLAAEKALREEQERREEQARALKEEQFDLAASFKELEKSGREWSDFLATTLVDAYGASFEALGAEMVNQGEGWKVFKEAGKEAIASILKAFGIEWAAQALAAYAALNFPAGAGYTLASGAAFAGVGVVRALEHGGWINEPVVGRGLETGATYAIAEKGPEYVSSTNVNNVNFPNRIVVRIGNRDFDAFVENEIDNRRIKLNPGAMKR